MDTFRHFVCRVVRIFLAGRGLRMVNHYSLLKIIIVAYQLIFLNFVLAHMAKHMLDHCFIEHSFPFQFLNYSHTEAFCLQKVCLEFSNILTYIVQTS